MTRKEYQRQWYLANAERTKAEAREKYKENKALFSNRARNYRLRNPKLTILRRIKQRATMENLDFNLDESDIIIPELCPALGIPIRINSGKQADDSVSVDRIDPSKGYIKGNVVLISFLANRIKSNATAEQVSKVALWMEKICFH